MDNYVITIGRRMGSGGRQLAHTLADRLGIRYYDRELLVEAARDAGMAVEFFEKNDERFPRWVSGLFSFAQGYLPLNAAPGGSMSADRWYSAMSEIIRRITARESCVIVGRTADYILRDNPRCVNVFVHAPEDECVRRIMERGGADNEAAARNLADKTNRLRADFYNFYTDKRWGDSSSYDLTVDCSRLDMDKCVDLIISYLKLRGIEP